jgi:hypothetical protein
MGPFNKVTYKSLSEVLPSQLDKDTVVGVVTRLQQAAIAECSIRDSNTCVRTPSALIQVAGYVKGRSAQSISMRVLRKLSPLHSAENVEANKVGLS